MGILDDDVARVREATDLVALVQEHVALEARRSPLPGTVPVPSGEDAVVLGESRQGRLALLRLPEERRRDHVRARGRASRLRRGDRTARRARQHHVALRRRVVLGGAQAQAAAARGGAGRDRVLPPAPARIARRRARAPLPAQPRLRRRRGAPVLARLGARRLRPAELAPAEGEVRAPGHRRRRARVREPREQAAGRDPRSADVPDLGHSAAIPSASAAARSPTTARSTRTPRRRRSTTSRDCSTA